MEKEKIMVIMPKITVMQPEVINTDNTGTLENVASEGLDTEQGVILPKIDEV
jgi:stage III sporulation protein SpoIIIAA